MGQFSSATLDRVDTVFSDGYHWITVVIYLNKKAVAAHTTIHQEVFPRYCDSWQPASRKVRAMSLEVSMGQPFNVDLSLSHFSKSSPLFVLQI